MKIENFNLQFVIVNSGRKRRSIESILPQLQLRPESDVNQQDLPEIPIESWVSERY